MPTVEIQNPNGGTPVRVQFDKMPTDADIDEASKNLFAQAQGSGGGDATPTNLQGQMSAIAQDQKSGNDPRQDPRINAAAPPKWQINWVPGAPVDGLNISKGAPKLAPALGGQMLPPSPKGGGNVPPSVAARQISDAMSPYSSDNGNLILNVNAVPVTPAQAKRQVLSQPTAPKIIKNGPFTDIAGTALPNDAASHSGYDPSARHPVPGVGTRVTFRDGHVGFYDMQGRPLTPKEFGHREGAAILATSKAGLASNSTPSSESFAGYAGGVKQGLRETGSDIAKGAQIFGKSAIQLPGKIAEGAGQAATNVVAGTLGELYSSSDESDLSRQTTNQAADNVAELSGAPAVQRALKEAGTAGGRSLSQQYSDAFKGDPAMTTLNTALNLIPAAAGLGTLSKIGVEFATKAGVEGMSRLSAKALADADAIRPADPVKATQLEAAGMKYQQIASALKSGKNLGALQLSLGYEGPNYGKTITEATGKSAAPVAPAKVSATAPIDAKPEPPFAPKVGANGKPIIKTLTSKAPDVAPGRAVTVPATAFDKPQSSGWQEPAATAPVESAPVAPVAAESPHHANFQPRADDGTFTPGQPAVPAGMHAPKNAEELAPVLQQTFGFAPDKAETVAALYDARARTWAAENNRPVGDWYANKLFTQGWGKPEAATPTPKAEATSTEPTPAVPGTSVPTPAVSPQSTVSVLTDAGRSVTMEVNGHTRAATLTPEQSKAWEAEQARFGEQKASIQRDIKGAQSQEQRAFHERRMKTAAMQNAANRRAIVPEFRTTIEAKAAADREASNYVGKPVHVGNKSGTVTGNSFGRVGVKFDDGTTGNFAPSDVTPKGSDTLLQEGPHQTETPEFKQWFGDSKVVDANGKPLVVYHGTVDNFNQFDKAKVKSRHEYSLGFHFTDRPTEAAVYASDSPASFANKQYKGNVIPVYLKAERPLVIDTKMMTASMEADTNRHVIMGHLLDAKKSGNPYDSVIIRRHHGDGYDGQNVIVFDPKQIKSAIGNRGTFDPNDPNILHQGGSRTTAQAAVDFTRDGRVIVRALSKPNVSSAIHELGHIIRRDLPKADLATVEQYFGVKEGQWRTGHEERFARTFERYIRDGIAPTKVLEGPFAKMKQWMRDIYAHVTGTPLETAVHPVVKDLFDKALGKGREEAATPFEKPRVSISSAETRGETPKAETVTQSAAPNGGADRVNGINVGRRDVEPEVKDVLRQAAESAGTITRTKHDAMIDTARGMGLQNSHLVNPSELSVDKPYPYPFGYSPEAFGHALRELDTQNGVAVKRAEIDYQDDPSAANAKKLADASLNLKKSNAHAQFIASQAGGTLGAHRVMAGPFRSFVTSDIFTPSGMPPPVGAKGFGESNKLFTRDRGTAALAKIQSGDVRLFQKAVSPAVEYGGYLLEGGLRKFPDWFKQMKQDVGAHLTDNEIRQVWQKLKPEAQRRADQLNSPKEGMRKLLLQTTDDPKVVEQISKDLAGVKENPDGSLPSKESRKLAELGSKYTKEGWVGTFKHGLRAGMLSGPGTLKKIALLHVLGAAFEENLVRPGATAHSAVRTALTGAERTTTMNPIHTAQAVAAGAKALPRALDILAHGENQLTLRGKNALPSPDKPIRSEFNLGLNRLADRANNSVGKGALNAVNSGVNAVVRLPMRSHGALYHMIGSALYQRGLLEAASLQAMKEFKAGEITLPVGKVANRSLAIKTRADELMRHPTPEMMDHAHAFYSEQMYQNPNAAASALRELPGKATKSLPALRGPVEAAVNFEAPFATVPLNVAGRAIESSPAGAIKYVAQLAQGKKLTPADMANMDRTFGRFLAGTGATILGYHLLKGMMQAPNSDKGKFSPTITVPKGPWPFSGRAVDTGEVAPVMNGVNFLVAHNGGSPIKDQAAAAVGHTPYSSIADEIQQVQEAKGNYANRMAASELGKFIPAFLRQSAAEFDPTHDVRRKQTIPDYLANAIPGPPAKVGSQAVTRQALPPMHTPGGSPIPEGGGYSALRNVPAAPIAPMDKSIALYFNLLDKAKDPATPPPMRAQFFKAALAFRKSNPLMDARLKMNTYQHYLAATKR